MGEILLMVNIYWKDAVKRGLKVRSTRTGWAVGNKTVYWNGQEARQAQAKLYHLATSRKRRK